MSTSSTRLYIPPDGGWGWVVVFAAFGAHLVTHGVLYSFGIIFIALQDTYGEDKATTAWIGSLATGFLFMSGPLTGAIIERCSCRVATITGAVVSCVGYILSVFATSIRVLYFTMGVMAGVGYGLIFVSSVVCVTQYFDTKRGVACSIALSGAVGGAFVFNPLVQFLLTNYGLHGTMLIEGGFLLNCIVFGALYRPVSSQTLGKRNRKVQKFHNESTLKSTDNVGVTEQLINRKTESTDAPASKFDNMIKAPVANIAVKTMHPSSHSGEKPAYIPQLPPNGVHGGSASCIDDRCIDKMIKCEGLRRQRSLPAINNDPAIRNSQLKVLKQKSLLFYSQPMLTGSCLTLPLGDEESIRKNNHDISRKTAVMISVFEHLALFKDKVFVMFMVSQCSLHVGVYIPFIYIPDKGLQEGISGYMVPWLVSIMGLSSIVGRILFGHLADRPCVNRLHLYGGALLISGVSTALGVIYTSLPALTVYVVVYGAFIGVAISLSSVVLVDLLGLAKLPLAFGIINLINGMSCLAGPVTAGWLFDITGSYNLAFLTMGAIMATGAIMMHVTSCLKR